MAEAVMAVIIDELSDWKNFGEKGGLLSVVGRIMNPNGITRAESVRAGKRLKYSSNPTVKRHLVEKQANGTASLGKKKRKAMITAPDIKT